MPGCLEVALTVRTAAWPLIAPLLALCCQADSLEDRAAEILAARLSHGLGEAPLGAPAAQDPLNQRILVFLRNPVSSREIQRHFPGVRDIDARLDALEYAKLVRHDTTGKYRTSFPLLVGDTAERYYQLTRAAADRLEPELVPSFQALFAELAQRGWSAWAYHFAWSEVFDSQFVWTAMVNRKLAPPLIPMITWVVYPEHPFKSGTNYYPTDQRSELLTVVTWTAGRKRVLTELGPKWRELQSAPGVPVLRASDLLYADLRSMAEAYVHLLEKHLPIEPISALAGSKADHAWEMAYHDVSWELLGRLARRKLIRRPEALDRDVVSPRGLDGVYAIVERYPPFFELLSGGVSRSK